MEIYLPKNIIKKLNKLNVEELREGIEKKYKYIEKKNPKLYEGLKKFMEMKAN